MPAYINPFTDFGFKRLFGSELHYTKNDFRGESALVDRKVIFDISCKGVNLRQSPELLSRLLSY